MIDELKPCDNCVKYQWQIESLRSQLAELRAEMDELKQNLATQTAKNYELCELYLKCGYASKCSNYKDALHA